MSFYLFPSRAALIGSTCWDTRCLSSVHLGEVITDPLGINVSNFVGNSVHMLFVVQQLITMKSNKYGFLTL